MANTRPIVLRPHSTDVTAMPATYFLLAVSVQTPTVELAVVIRQDELVELTELVEFESELEEFWELNLESVEFGLSWKSTVPIVSGSLNELWQQSARLSSFVDS